MEDKRTLWEMFLDDNFCHANPMTGNRPCDDRPGHCGACSFADDLWEDYKKKWKEKQKEGGK